MLNSTQEKILLTASRLFYTQGIRTTGVDTIIKEAGISKMSLYKYYASKNDLIIAYLLRQEKIYINRYESIALKIDSPKDKLLAIFDINNESMESDEYRGCPFFNALSEFLSDEEPVRKVALEIFNRLWRLIVNLAEQSEINQPNSLASQLTLLLYGSILSEQVNRYAGVANHAKEIAEILINTNRTIPTNRET